MALAVSTPSHSTPSHSTPSQNYVDENTTLAGIRADLTRLSERGLAPADSVQAAAWLQELEAIERQSKALSIDLMGAIDRAGLHYDDGHTSAKVMARHVVKLSGAEAAGRDRCRRMFVHLELIATEYRAGRLGTDQVMLLARVWANPRVQDAMKRRQKRFIKDARRLSFPRFRSRVLEWQRLADEDGAEPERDRTFENRNAQLVQNHFDQSWDLKGIFGAEDGAAMSELLNAYVQALFDADWAEARARLGDAACTSDLSRTDAQRRADALRQIFADAAANQAGMAPSRFVHNIVWSADAWEEMVRRCAGGTPTPFDPDTFRCETPDGVSLDPTEAFANAIQNKIRRVVIDAKGVVIDMGTARLFTGLARDAVRIAGRECFWPGCWVPASRCETDHLHDHAKGGRTNPGNGAPGCGRHNRWKQKGYKVWRDNNGQIHVQRPNGTEIA